MLHADYFLGYIGPPLIRGSHKWPYSTHNQAFKTNTF